MDHREKQGDEERIMYGRLDQTEDKHNNKGMNRDIGLGDQIRVIVRRRPKIILQRKPRVRY